MPNYRYRFLGPDEAELIGSMTNSTGVVTVAGGSVWLDVQNVDAADKAELDEFMAEYGYVFISADPGDSVAQVAADAIVDAAGVNTEPVTFNYDPVIKTRLISVVTASKTSTLSYNGQDELITVVTVEGGQTITKTLSYVDGQLTGKTVVVS